MNMLYYFKLKTAYSDLDFFEIRLRVLLKNSEIILKKCQKKTLSVWVEAGELKICMNMLYYECFIAWFWDFE
jgi:hypothetical protein